VGSIWMIGVRLASSKPLPSLKAITPSRPVPWSMAATLAWPA
jgi:hypothetical protein